MTLLSNKRELTCSLFISQAHLALLSLELEIDSGQRRTSISTVAKLPYSGFPDCSGKNMTVLLILKESWSKFLKCSNNEGCSLVSSAVLTTWLENKRKLNTFHFMTDRGAVEKIKYSIKTKAEKLFSCNLYTRARALKNKGFS